MKNKKILAFFLSVFLLFGVQGVSAQEENVNADITEEKALEMLDKFPKGDPSVVDLADDGSIGNVDCFDYYKFQSVQVSAELSQKIVAPGEKARFDVELENDNEYPIVNGYLFARVSKKNENFLEDGNYIVDEFFALKKVSIDAGAKMQDSFLWNVPALIQGGDYQVDFFFTEGKKFNLSGLSFTNEVIASKADFKVEPKNNDRISFTRKNSLVNGEKYNHIGDWPQFKSGNKVNIEHELENSFSDEKEVKIKHELYYWDSLDESNKLETKEETLKIAANSKQIVSFEISKIQEPVYYLKTTASIDGQSSIMNTRVLGDSSKARLNSVILGSFPIEKGDKTSLSACFHSVSQNDFNGKVEVNIFDKKGKKIDGWTYSGKIPSQVSANNKDVKFSKDYDYLNIKAKITDENDKLIDEYSVVYDCSKLNLKGCKADGLKGAVGLSTKNWLNIIVIIPILVLLGYLLFKKIKSNKRNNFLLLLIIAFIIIFALVVFAQFKSLIDSGKVKGDSTAQIESKSVTTSSNYWHYVGDRFVTSGNISVNYETEPNISISNLETGNSFSFAFDYNRPTFNANGGSWDTPYAKWTTDAKDDGDIETNPGYLTRNFMYNVPSYAQKISGGGSGGYITWVCNKPSLKYDSSDNQVVSCSGASCKTNNAGKATVTATIGRTFCRLYSLISYDYPYGSTKRMFPSYRGKAPNCTNGTGPGCCYDNWDHNSPAFVWGSDDAVWSSSLGGTHFYNLTYPGCFTRDKFRTPHSQSSTMSSKTKDNGTYKISLPAKWLTWDVNVVASNRAPSASITNPSSNVTVREKDSITFTGKGTDPDGDTISAYDWRTGTCGTGTYLSNKSSFNYSSLGIGTHKIYFRVQDSKGAWSTCDSRSVTVVANKAPTASITSPSSDLTVKNGDNIAFAGTGTDPDGDTISAYDWRTGTCGTGTYLSNSSSFNYSSLGIGTYQVYFRVQDSKGTWSACDSRKIVVTPDCSPSTPPAGSAFCSGDNENLTGTANISITKVNSEADCTADRKCEYYIFPINGEVGPAKNQIFCQRPSENLCEKGTPSDVTEGDDGKSWVWTCKGIYGGSDAQGKAVKSCAYQEVNPN